MYFVKISGVNLVQYSENSNINIKEEMCRWRELSLTSWIPLASLQLNLVLGQIIMTFTPYFTLLHLILQTILT